jgi:branched-subunit amino acid ABC-type transport system permease component
VIVCSVLNFAIEKIAYRPLRNAPRLAPLITAMGMSLLLQTLAMIIWKPNYKSFPILLPGDPHYVCGAVINNVQILILVSTAITLTGLMYLVNRTRSAGRCAPPPRTRASPRSWASARHRDLGDLRHRRRARRARRRDVRRQLRLGAAHHGLPARAEGVHGGGVRRHRQPRRAMVGRRAARPDRVARRRLHRRSHRRRPRSHYQDIFAFVVLILVLTLRPQGLLGERVADEREAPVTRFSDATRQQSWPSCIGAVLLFILPFVVQMAGNAWVRIIDIALLYVLLALGLNIVVGYAGLLDLGYVAFYAVGAYMLGLLASPQLTDTFPAIAAAFPNGLHVPWWLVIPLGALVAGVAGVLLGAPTLKLRGDYLAIVTLGFGEIVRVFLNNLDAPVNITNGPKASPASTRSRSSSSRSARRGTASASNGRRSPTTTSCSCSWWSSPS